MTKYLITAGMEKPIESQRKFIVANGDSEALARTRAEEMAGLQEGECTAANGWSITELANCPEGYVESRRGLVTNGMLDSGGTVQNWSEPEEE